MFLLVGGDSEIGRIAAAQLGARALATTRRPRGASDKRLVLDLAEDPLHRFEPPGGVTSACILAAVARLSDCARDPAGSARVNVDGTIALADRLIARGVHVLFVSSDKVFDGKVPQVPADAPTAPVSEYGRRKAQTEATLRTYMQRGAPVAVLWLAKVLSPATALLLDWTAGLKAKKPIRAFQYLTMAPVAAATVVRTFADLPGDRSLEMCVHPGFPVAAGEARYRPADVNAWIASPARRMEHDALTDAEVDELVRRRGIVLRRFDGTEKAA